MLLRDLDPLYLISTYVIGQLFRVWSDVKYGELTAYQPIQ